MKIYEQLGMGAKRGVEMCVNKEEMQSWLLIFRNQPCCLMTVKALYNTSLI